MSWWQGIKRMFAPSQCTDVSRRIDAAMGELHEASDGLSRSAVRSILRDQETIEYEDHDKYAKDVGAVIARVRAARKK